MVKRFSLTVFLVLVLAVTTFVPVYAQEVQPVDPIYPVPTVEIEGFIDETPEAWFVELNSKPTVEGTSLSVTKAEKRAFRDAARRAGVKYTDAWPLTRCGMVCRSRLTSHSYPRWRYYPE